RRAGGRAHRRRPARRRPRRIGGHRMSEQSPKPESAGRDEQLTVVHVVRHGEVHNPDGVLYGRRPGYHLSDLGRPKADRVRAHLDTLDITHVSASPLARPRDPAAPIAKAPGLARATDARLTAAANVVEGKTFGVGDGALRKPDNWKHLPSPFKPSWGEPYV